MASKIYSIKTDKVGKNGGFLRTHDLVNLKNPRYLTSPEQIYYSHFAMRYPVNTVHVLSFLFFNFFGGNFANDFWFDPS